MKPNEMLKLYQTEYVTDPKSGKQKSVARYIGPWYLVDMQKKKRLTAQLWLGWLAAVAAFLTAGLIPTWASLCGYVVPFYMLCLAPIIYLFIAGIRIARMKERITLPQKTDGLNTALYAALGLALLGLVWTVTTAVFLLTNQVTMTFSQELIFLAMGVVSAADGTLLTLMIRRFTVEPEDNEKAAV